MGFGAVYLCVPTLGGGIVWVGRKRKSEKDCYNEREKHNIRSALCD